MKFLIRKLLFTLLILITLHLESMATHLRAGEITAQLLDCNSLHYKITLVLYTDLGSTVRPGGGELDFGDGSPAFSFNARDPDFFENLGDEVGHNIFYTEHTFPGNGIYTIRYREFNRNGGVANMDNSVNTPFYIETKIYIDPFLKCNNTPVLLNPPLDRACAGKAFYHNPAAWDPDGDSLSYELVINKQDIDIPVANYTYPNIHDIQTVPGAQNEEKTGPPTYTLNPVTGDLVWDAPAQEGEYNIAFLIKEWRYSPLSKEWYSMGYVTRDMQIIVQECKNQKPELTMPNDTCVQAGTLLKVDIKADDPDGDPVTIQAFGGPFEINPNAATYTPLYDPKNPMPVPAFIHFSWQTGCNHVQERPYQVTVKAKDDPSQRKDAGAALVDFKNWFITVVAPAPQGLSAQYQTGRKVKLTWDDYLCKANAQSMEIWRRVDSFKIEPGHCETGMPGYAGYELIKVTGIDTNEFIDNNRGKGLAYGATYCYRIVAYFPLPKGGESYVSDEVCVTVEEDQKRFGPVITKVSVKKTDLENGAIDLQWTSPFDADKIAFPPPYTYHIYRGENGKKDLIKAAQFNAADTIYSDTTINTLDNFYNYLLIAIDANGKEVDTSAWASSVRLNSEPNVNKIGLSWKADVPWSNNTQEFPYHYIYRDRIDINNLETLFLIDSVNVNLNGFNYIDSGQVNNTKLDETTTYCYYVTTQGSYGNPKVYEPLVNNSQVICSQPNDTIPPCKIEGSTIKINPDIDCQTFVSDKPCDFDKYYHKLSWTNNTNTDCENDIKEYQIWFSKTGMDGDFQNIASVSSTNYTHSDLSSFAGCYKIRAVDRSGNVSEFSDKVCYENCPKYELPNIFTPNNDGFNDTFQAFTFPYDKCPRFVKSVDFKVFDRWGTEIYRTTGTGETSIYVNWNGKTSSGKLVPSGVYYYIADVEFENIQGALRNMQIKGWMQVLR
jgi:gliding motility-associated-like protein